MFYSHAKCDFQSILEYNESGIYRAACIFKALNGHHSYVCSYVMGFPSAEVGLGGEGKNCHTIYC